MIVDLAEIELRGEKFKVGERVTVEEYSYVKLSLNFLKNNGVIRRIYSNDAGYKKFLHVLIYFFNANGRYSGDYDFVASTIADMYYGIEDIDLSRHAYIKQEYLKLSRVRSNFKDFMRRLKS